MINQSRGKEFVRLVCDHEVVEGTVANTWGDNTHTSDASETLARSCFVF